MQKERDETKEAVADIAKSLQVEKETAQDLFLIKSKHKIVSSNATQIFQDQMDGNAKDLLDVVKREKVRFEHVTVWFQDSLQQKFSV